MVIARYFKSARRRVVAIVSAVLLATATAVVSMTGVAHASATTCIQTSLGVVCTYVNGSSNHVNYVEAEDSKVGEVCGESAWFYYVPPTGGAYGLAALTHNGCTDVLSAIDLHLNRTFAHKTLICVKYYLNYWAEYQATDCVGLS